MQMALQMVRHLHAYPINRIHLLDRHKMIMCENNMSSLIMFSKIKLGPQGIMPSRAHPGDVGYDLTLVTKKGYNWGPNIEVYGTQIYLQPDGDLYFEIIPRSSIVRTPYMLANSVAVLDPSFEGEILVVLRKIDTSRPSLELPSRIVQ